MVFTSAQPLVWGLLSWKMQAISQWPCRRLQQHFLLLHRHAAGPESIPGHAMWTGLSGYAIGCWLSRGNTLPSISGTAYLSDDAEANWVLYDKRGAIIEQSSWTTIPSPQMVKLLGKHQNHAWPMPQTITAGLLLAIAGHALWNGSSCWNDER